MEKFTLVRNWYLEQYDDALGKEIDLNITFDDIVSALDQQCDIYEKIGVADSIIRERIFLHLSIIKGVKYEAI